MQRTPWLRVSSAQSGMAEMGKEEEGYGRRRAPRLRGGRQVGGVHEVAAAQVQQRQPAAVQHQRRQVRDQRQPVKLHRRRLRAWV